jgi:hypothetical protein
MRRFAPILFVGFGVAIGGCILGLDSLTGGNGSSDDGGENGDVVTGNEASLVDDSSTPDGSNADAGDSGSFCPQAGSVLCDDFDDPDASADVPGPWDYAYAPAGAIVTATNLLSKSPPRSVEIGTSTATVAILSKTVDATHVDIAFDLFIQINGDNSSIVGFSIGNAQVIVKPESATQTTFLEEDTLADGGVTYLGTSTTTGVATGRWVHVETVVDFPSHVAQLSLDGTQVLQRNLTGAAWISARSANVTIGTADSSSTTFFYDNVVIRTD